MHTCVRGCMHVCEKKREREGGHCVSMHRVVCLCGDSIFTVNECLCVEIPCMLSICNFFCIAGVLF